MSKDNPKDIESVVKKWNEHAKSYDEWYDRFEGAVEHYVDWQLLKEHLPTNKNSKILDAAGGTGRIALPLAKMGYSITLCDISPGMLNVAKQKLLKEEVSDKVEILECDVCKLPFPDESFDLVLCWGGMNEAVKELIRVTKKGGKISMFLTNRYRGAIDSFSKDPAASIDLVESRSDYISHGKEKHKVTSEEEAIYLFKAEGIKVIETYAVCGWITVLRVPEKILESKRRDEKLFNQVTKMILKLSKEPSVKGMSRHIVLYGKKI